MKEVMRRKLLTVLLLFAFLFTTACSGVSNSDGGKVELRWMMWTGSPEEKKVWEELAKKVTEKYPNIEVKLETSSWNGYWDKLKTQLASGTAPDIISLQSLRTLIFAQYNAFEPLNDYIKKTPQFDIDDFEKSIMEGLSYNGKQLAIPYDFGPLVLFYNKDIFDKYGVKYPDEKMNWDQFLKKAKDVTKDTNGDGEPDTYGFVFQNSIDLAVPWIWSNGGDYMDKDASKAMIQEPEATEAIQFLADLIHKHKVAVPITDPGNENFWREQFYSGKVAMYIDGPWNFVNLRSKVNFDWDITTIPAGRAGSITCVAGSGFGIYSKSKHKEEAWKAISVMMSKEGHEFLAKTGRAFPARKSAIDAFENASDKPANLEVINLAGKTGRPFAVTTNWQETQLMINQQLDKVWFNNVPAQKVTKEIEPLFNKLLNEHQKNISK